MKATINAATKDVKFSCLSEFDKQLQVNISDWLHNYPLRIIAPKALALVYPQIYIWFQINDLPIEKVGDMMHLYCNEIIPEHQGLIEANSEIITVETKPI